LIGGDTTRIYMENNLMVGPDGRKHEVPPDSEQQCRHLLGPVDVEKGERWGVFGNARDINKRAEPFPTAPVRTDRPEEAYRRVLAEAGATLPARDAVDTRIVEDVRRGRGRIIDSQSEVGGWPELSMAEPH